MNYKNTIISSILLLLIASPAIYAASAFYATTNDTIPTYHYRDDIKITHYEPTESIRTFIIDPSKHAQQYLGVGSSFEEATIYNLMLANETQRKSLLQQLFGHDEQDFNLNLVRVTLGTSDFTPKINGKPYYYTYADKDLDSFTLDVGPDHLEMKKIGILKQALTINPHILFFASAWSPPAWMKQPDNLNKIPNMDGMIGGKFDPSFTSSLATYYLKAIQGYQQFGINFYAISEFNEPCVGRDTEVPYPNVCIELNDAKYLAHTMKQTFLQNQINTKIWLNDYNFGNGWSIVNAVLNDPNAKNDFDGIAYHSYYGNVHDMKSVYDFYQRYLNNSNPADFKGVYMTEFMTGWMRPSTSQVDRIVDAARLLEYFHQGSSSYINWVTLYSKAMGAPSGEHTDPIHPNPWFPPNLIQTEDDQTYHFDIMAYALGAISKSVEQNAYLLDDATPRINSYYDDIVEYSTPYQATDINEYGTSEHLPIVSQITFQNPDRSLVTVFVNTDSHPNDIKLVSSDKQYQIQTTIPAHAIETLKWRLPE